MQDFTGVPCVVDLAAMREAIVRLGGDRPARQPARAGRARHRPLGAGRRIRRRRLARAQQRDRVRAATASATRSCAGARPRSATSRSCRRTPASCTRSTSSTSARVVFAQRRRPAAPWPTRTRWSAPTRTPPWSTASASLGWGVGGIEAEAAMLGQPVTMLIPQVIGFKLTGALPAGTTATDLVLTDHRDAAQEGRGRQVRRVLRRRARGPAARRPRHHRATCRRSSAAPARSFRSTRRRFATCELTGRDRGADRPGRGLCQGAGPVAHPRRTPRPTTPTSLELDLATVEPSLAGPKRPQDRVPLRSAKTVYQNSLKRMAEERAQKNPNATGIGLGDDRRHELRREGRRRADRGHHQLHEHLEPGRAGGRGPAGAQRPRSRPQIEALGQDLTRAGLARRHRLPAARPACSADLEASGLLHGRLWLHHLHRQLGALETGDLRGGQGRATSSPPRCCRATAISKAVCIPRSR